MKAIRHLIILCSLLLFSETYAQKNAPVAGDVGLLVDLLKKNYSSIDPVSVEEELIKDRALVIAIFKAYMSENQKSSLLNDASYTSISFSTTVIADYKTALQTLSNYSTEGVKNANYASQLSNLSSTVEIKRKEMQVERYNVDIEELQHIKSHYLPENKYIVFMLDQFILKYNGIMEKKADAFAKSDPSGSLQKGIPFIGGDMGFEVVIEGLSKFLAKRIKEELTTAVIDKVKDWLENPKENDPLAELKIILPRTNQYLLNFRASQVTSFPNEIKQYIEDDFNHIIENMSGLKGTPRIQRLVEYHPDIDFALEALELIPNLQKIKNPIDYFELIEKSRNISRWKDSDHPVKFNIANVLELSSMLAYSYAIVENGQTRMAGNNFINSYSGDLNFYLLYLGFLRQQNAKYFDVQFMIKTTSDFNLTTIHDPKNADVTNEPVRVVTLPLLFGLDKLIDKFDAAKLNELRTHRQFFEELFVQIGKNSEKVYNSVMEIKKANKKGARIGSDTIYSFVKSIINLAEEVSFAADTFSNYMMRAAGIVQYSISAIKIDYSSRLPVYTITSSTITPNFQTLKLKQKAEPYFRLANSTNDIVFDLQKKKYATAIIKTLEITSQILPDELNQKTELLTRSIALAKIQPDAIENKWHLEDYYRVFSTLNKATSGTEFKSEKNVRVSSIVISAELKKIRDNYNHYYDVETSILTDLGALVSEVAKLNSKTKIILNDSALSNAKALLSNNKFKQLLISYYAGFDVTEFATKLETELKLFTIDVKGNPIRIFTDSEASTFKANFETYLYATFNYLVDKNKKGFETANTTFIENATSLLVRAPLKFNFHLNENTLKLIHFINDMALAGNSDDIEKAIEAFALPAGSYSIKRESLKNISINSYPGILPAFEVTWKRKASYGSFSPAFTVPVGLSFTKGDKKGRSNGIFIPVIDIGAVTRMHLTNDIDNASDSTTSATLPEFSFLSIFSPGIYYHHGFKKTPLSLNIGAQYGPGLRELKNNGQTKIYESLRIGVALVIDIPLINLYTKPRFEE